MARNPIIFPYTMFQGFLAGMARNPIIFPYTMFQGFLAGMARNPIIFPYTVFQGFLAGMARNPIIFPYTNHDNENLRINFKITDMDGGGRHELIDNLYDIIYFNTSTTTPDTKSVRHLAGRVSTLTFAVRVSCTDDYYGQNCNHYCHTTPLSHYTCDVNGVKKCHKHWFGPTCDKQCRPSDNRHGHYRCSDVGDKICRSGWFGADCRTFCEPTVNAQEAYTCNIEDGSKICSDFWYGPNCDVWCRAGPSDHFTCDEVTGQKVCHRWGRFFLDFLIFSYQVRFCNFRLFGPNSRNSKQLKLL